METEGTRENLLPSQKMAVLGEPMQRETGRYLMAGVEDRRRDHELASSFRKLEGMGQVLPAELLGEHYPAGIMIFSSVKLVLHFLTLEVFGNKFI